MHLDSSQEGMAGSADGLGKQKIELSSNANEGLQLFTVTPRPILLLSPVIVIGTPAHFLGWLPFL